MYYYGYKRENTEGKHTHRILVIFKSKIELEEILRDNQYEQQNDRKLNWIINSLGEFTTDNTHNHYVLLDNLIFRKKLVNSKYWKFVITGNIAEKFVQDYCERFGHIGLKKTISELKEHFVIQTLEKNVSQIVGK